MSVTLMNADCLDAMWLIPDGSVDLILCDLPYGTTACKWDSVIPFEPLWAHYWRVLKPNGVVALTASQPFTTSLISSQIERFRYSWVWEKDQGVNFLSAKKHPLKVHEDVCIFYQDLSEQKGSAPQFDEIRAYLQSEREKTRLSSKELRSLLGNDMQSHYFTNGVQFCIPSSENYAKLQTTGFFSLDFSELKSWYDRMSEGIEPSPYFPQMSSGAPYVSGRGSSGEVTGSVEKIQTVNCGTRYPRSVVKVKRETGLHPTQKPVALMEYLIKTYTNEGETVLDNCMGSGTTGVACRNTGRKFIGIERDPEYFRIAQERIE